MTTDRPNRLRHDLAHQVILGFLGGVLISLPVIALTWLILGHPPNILTLIIVVEIIAEAITITVAVRRRIQRNRLEAMYNQPAHGEDQ
ncbi:hypothetical protein [Streptomyces sp. NPDC059783]|uniref:hypothetical protein n=1 Tax=Streptomyces sp. NPDC059783 TaxID=3346944 RepID=UPI00366840AF